MTCPGCGTEGDGDDVLAGDQKWCTTDTDECRVVSYHAGDDAVEPLPAPQTLQAAEYHQQCPRCDTVLGIHSKYCSGCGVRFKTDADGGDGR